MIKKQQQKIKLLAFLVFKQTFLFLKRASQTKQDKIKKPYSKLNSYWHNFKSIPYKIRIKIWIITNIISAQHCTEEPTKTSKTGRRSK